MRPAKRTSNLDFLGGRSLRLLAVICGLCTLSSVAVAAGSGNGGRTAQIVGLGAAACRQFTADAAANPQVRNDYLAWAQGFMSGIRLSRPPDVDVELDLNPPTFGLMAQLHFLEEQCARNETIDFSTAVEALYKRLRAEGRT